MSEAHHGAGSACSHDGTVAPARPWLVRNRFGVVCFALAVEGGDGGLMRVGMGLL